MLDRFTKEMELETLHGNLTANRSKLQADEAGLKMEKARRKRADPVLLRYWIKRIPPASAALTLASNCDVSPVSVEPLRNRWASSSTPRTTGSMSEKSAVDSEVRLTSS